MDAAFTARQCWPIGQFRECSISNPILSVLRKHLDWSVQFFSVFRWLPSIGKLRMTPVSFSKTTESYKVSLVTFSWQTSYDSESVRQDYRMMRQDDRLIQGLPIWVLHLPERTETGLITASGLINGSHQSVRAVHSWFLFLFLFLCKHYTASYQQNQSLSVIIIIIMFLWNIYTSNDTCTIMHLKNGLEKVLLNQKIHNVKFSN